MPTHSIWRSGGEVSWSRPRPMALLWGMSFSAPTRGLNARGAWGRQPSCWSQHGQREAATTSDDQSLNTDPITLTKLEMYTILIEKARLRSSKCRPLDLEAKERTMIVLNALYPNGIPPHIDSQDQNFVVKISTFVSKCEKLYNDSARNLKRFCKKNEKWLATIFDLDLPWGARG